MKEFIVRKQIAINAAPAEVWDALTNPEKTKKYFFNCEVFSSWKVGEEIIFKGRIFLIKKIELAGKILKIEPGRVLKYTLNNGQEDNDNGTSFSIVTDEISYTNGQTFLSITDDVGNADGAAERYKKSIKGWDKVLKGLKKLVEKN
ncbi:MAG: SRPBCC domain-containing protein [Bacteroidota bacterium]